MNANRLPFVLTYLSFPKESVAKEENPLPMQPLKLKMLDVVRRRKNMRFCLKKMQH